MRFLNREYNRTETTLLFILAIVTIAFFMQGYAMQLTINEHINALTECRGNFYKLQSGVIPMFENYSININLTEAQYGSYKQTQ